MSPAPECAAAGLSPCRIPVTMYQGLPYPSTWPHFIFLSFEHTQKFPVTPIKTPNLALPIANQTRPWPLNQRRESQLPCRHCLLWPGELEWRVPGQRPWPSESPHSAERRLELALMWVVAQGPKPAVPRPEWPAAAERIAGRALDPPLGRQRQIPGRSAYQRGRG